MAPEGRFPVLWILLAHAGDGSPASPWTWGGGARAAPVNAVPPGVCENDLQLEKVLDFPRDISC